MDILLIKGADIMMGVGQSEYLTVPLRKGSEMVETVEGGLREVPNMTGAFKPTPEELKKLNEGASIHICVLGTAWAPMKIMVQDPTLPGQEPDDAEFDQGNKGQAQPLNPGQFVLGTEAGAVTVTERADPCTLRVGDEVSHVEGQRVGGLRAALAMVTDLLANGRALQEFRVIRGGHYWNIIVAASNDGHALEKASCYEPEDLGPIGHAPGATQ